MLGAWFVMETTSGHQDVLVKYLRLAFSDSSGFGCTSRSQNPNVLFSVDPPLWFYLSAVIVFCDSWRDSALFEDISWNKPNKQCVIRLVK